MMHQEFTLLKLKFKNFRPFKDWQEFSPKKLNIFIGPNNSGKSSLSELLSMLSDGFPETLNNDHSNLRASRFENLVVDKKKPIELKFELSFNIKNFQPGKETYEISGFVLSPSVEVHLKYHLTRDDFPVKEIRLAEIKIVDTVRNISILDGELGGFKPGTFMPLDGDTFSFNWMDYYDDYIQKYSAETVSFLNKRSKTVSTKGSGKIFPARKSNAAGKKLLKYFNYWGVDGEFIAPEYDNEEVLKTRKGYAAERINFSNLSSVFFPGNPEDPFDGNSLEYRYNRITKESLEGYLKNSIGQKIPDINMMALAEYKYYFFYNLRSLFYNLGSTFPTSVNLKSGSLEQKELYSRKELLKLSDFFSETSSWYLKKKLNEWLSKLGITDSLEKVDVTEDYLKLLLSRHDKQISLHLLGHGTQQIVLTVIALQGNLLLSKRYFEYPDGKTRSSPNYNDVSGIPGEIEKLIFIQEPETNLHPKFQSQLADLLVDTVNRFFAGIVVETHSEYLIRKLQYLIAKKEISHEDVELVYFEEIKGNHESGKIRVIPIREDGFLLDEFGPGFYDESARWTFELFKLQSEN